MKNWKVTFEPVDAIQKRIEDVVRVQSDKTDPEDDWASLVKIDGDLIQMYLGAILLQKEVEK